MMDQSALYRKPWSDLGIILTRELKKAYYQGEKLDSFISESTLLFSYIWCQAKLVLEIKGGEPMMLDYLNGVVSPKNISFVSVRSKEFNIFNIIEESILFLACIDPRIDQKNREVFNFFKKKILIDSMLELDIPLDADSITKNQILDLYKKTSVDLKKIEGVSGGEFLFPQIKPYLEAYERTFSDYDALRRLIFRPQDDLTLEF